MDSAGFLQHADPNDVVLAAANGVFELAYVPRLGVRPLPHDMARLDSVCRSVVLRDPSASLRLVPHLCNHGGFGMQIFRRIEAWVRARCERDLPGAQRIDHQREFVGLWRCMRGTWKTSLGRLGVDG